MTTPRVMFVVLLSLGVLAAAGCGGSSNKVPAGAVALVNEQQISRAELDKTMERLQLVYKHNKQQFPKPGTDQYQALQTQYVTVLVRQAEYTQEARRLGLNVSPAEIDKRIAEYVKKLFAGSHAKFEKELKAQGYDDAAFRAGVKTELLEDKLLKRITRGVEVTDADVKTYYETNRSQYVVPDSRKVRHILVKTKTRAMQLYDQIKAGADFAKLEQKYSLDTGTNQQGGILDVTRGSTVAPYEQTAFLLPTGAVSHPVYSSQYGWFLIKPVGALQPGRTKPLAEVSKDIRTTLLDTKRKSVLTAWVAKLNESYKNKVEYASGFAPPQTTTTTTSPFTTG